MDIDCSALNRTVVEYKYTPKIYKYDIETFLYREGRLKIIKALESLVKREHKNVKVQLSLQIQISRLRNEETITITPWFNSQVFTLMTFDLIKHALIKPIKEILSNWDSFIHLGK